MLLSFAAEIVTVPSLSVCPAAIVRVVPLSEKSAAAVFVPAAAATVIVVSALEGRSSVAVTVLDPPFSEIESGASTRLTCGAGSLSEIVTLNPSAGSTDNPGTVVVPRTSTASSGSSMLSSTGASVNVPVWLVIPTGIVIVNSLTAAKSVPTSAVSPSTRTLTAVASGRAAASSAAVTVTRCAFPVAPSDTVSGETDSVTVIDSVSSSSIVRVCATGCSIAMVLAAVPCTVTCLFPV